MPRVILFSAFERMTFKSMPLFYRRAYFTYKAITDRGERRLIRSIVRPGMTTVDIGAYIGAYADFLQRCVGPTGRVIAFEPAEAPCQFLKLNLSRYPNTILVQSAVGERTSEITLYLSDARGTDHRTYDCGEPRRQIRTPCVTLDEYMADRKVDFVKIDVQGFEIEVLRGMRSTVKDNSEIRILLEYSPADLAAAGHSGRELIALLGEAGLKTYAIDKRGACHQLDGKPPALNSLGYTNILAQRNPPA